MTPERAFIVTLIATVVGTALVTWLGLVLVNTLLG